RQAFMLNYQSGFTEGAVGVGVDLSGAAAYQLADHGDYTGGMLFGNDKDRLNKAGATLQARAGNTTAYAGDLRPGTPVYVNNDARMLPQMVEGVLVTDQDIQGLTLSAGHITKFSARDSDRSEEHTSELQSRENLVCRLLLEKKRIFQHQQKR